MYRWNIITTYTFQNPIIIIKSFEANRAFARFWLIRFLFSLKKRNHVRRTNKFLSEKTSTVDFPRSFERFGGIILIQTNSELFFFLRSRWLMGMTFFFADFHWILKGKRFIRKFYLHSLNTNKQTLLFFFHYPQEKKKCHWEEFVNWEN